MRQQGEPKKIQACPGCMQVKPTKNIGTHEECFPLWQSMLISCNLVWLQRQHGKFIHVYLSKFTQKPSSLTSSRQPSYLIPTMHKGVSPKSQPIRSKSHTFHLNKHQIQTIFIDTQFSTTNMQLAQINANSNETKLNQISISLQKRTEMKFMAALELSPRSITIVGDRLKANRARNIWRTQRFASAITIINNIRSIQPHNPFLNFFPFFSFSVVIKLTKTLIRLVKMWIRRRKSKCSRNLQFASPVVVA